MIFDKVRRTISNANLKRIEEDAFMKRLKSLVVGEGMLHDGNLYLMDFAIKNMPSNGRVLEIGSYGGLSANLILHLLKINKREESFITCDPWIYEGFEDRFGNPTDTIDGRDDVSRQSYSIYMKNNFMRSIQFLHGENLPYSFQLSSDEFFEQYKSGVNAKDIFGRTIEFGKEFSFAYIDGNHAYEFVSRDFLNISDNLLQDGFILFDDSMDSMDFGSSRFMDEMKEKQ